MGVPIRDLFPRPTVRKEIDKIELPPPTMEAVNPEQMRHVLGFDPKRGSGDVDNAFNFGPIPWRVAENARKTARKMLPEFRGTNDDQDAVRHALGSFLLTRRYGAKDAKQILDGHERRPNSGLSKKGPPGAALQDLYNNRVGREAAQDPKYKGMPPDQVILELYRAGKLQTRPFKLK